jgi:hypothetical protein
VRQCIVFWLTGTKYDKAEQKSTVCRQEHLASAPIMHSLRGTQHDSCHGNSISQPDLNVWPKSEQGSRLATTIISDPQVKTSQAVYAVDQLFDDQCESKLNDHQHVRLPCAPLGKNRSPDNVSQQAYYSNLTRPSNTSSRQPGYATQILFPHNQHSKLVSHIPELGKRHKTSSVDKYPNATSDSCILSQPLSTGTTGLASPLAATAKLELPSTSAEATSVSTSPTVSTGLVSNSLSLSGTTAQQATQLDFAKPVGSIIHQQASSQQSSVPDPFSTPNNRADYHVTQQISCAIVGLPEPCSLFTEPSLVFPVVHTSQELSEQSSPETSELPPQYQMTKQKTLCKEADYESDFPPPPPDLQLEHLKPEVSNKAKQDSTVVTSQNVYNAFSSAGISDCAHPAMVQYLPSVVHDSQNQLPVKKPPPPPVAAKPKLAVQSLMPSGNKETFNCTVKSSDGEQKQLQRLQEIRRLESRPYLTANEQTKLHRLRIEAEFNRRLMEANDEENKESAEIELSLVVYILTCFLRRFQTIFVVLPFEKRGKREKFS